MPEIFKFRCNKCDLSLPSGWGRSTYVVRENGVRETCGHPGESFMVQQITGLPMLEAMAKGLCGVHRDCLCFKCLTQFLLDFGRDVRQCPSCLSTQVFSAEEMVGKSCPKCEQGEIIQEDTGWIS